MPDEHKQDTKDSQTDNSQLIAGILVLPNTRKTKPKTEGRLIFIPNIRNCALQAQSCNPIQHNVFPSNP